jgi:translation initiation factor IF-2
METFTVKKFATELGLPVNLLIEQLKSAGVSKAKSEDDISEEDKSALLKYLRNEHGGSQRPKAKITLTRKQNSEIRKTDSEGRARTIQVEVRKKRTILKPEENKPEDVKNNAPDKTVKVIDDNQKNIREDEAKRHSALADAQAAEAKNKKENKEKPKKEEKADSTLHRPASKIGVKVEKEKKKKRKLYG